MEKKDTNEVQIIEVKPEEFGLTVTVGEGITKGLKTILSERDALEEQYLRLIKSEINEETIVEARDLRLKIRDNRTKGIEPWHETEKKYWLSGGNFVDAIKRKEVQLNKRMEENLSGMEKHFENLEKERLDKIESARKEFLKEFPDINFDGYDLRNMTNDSFKQLLTDQRDLKKLREQKAIEEAQKQREAEAKSKLITDRKLASAKYSDFIPGYDILDFSIPENEWEAIMKTAQAEKTKADEKAALAEVENKRLRDLQLQKQKEETERLAKEKAIKDLQDKRLPEILKYNDPKTNKIDLNKLGELAPADYDRILANKKTDWEKAEKARKDQAEKEAKEKKETEERLAALQKQADDKKKADEEKQRQEAAEKLRLANAPEKEKMLNWLSGCKLGDVDVDGEKANEIKQDVEIKFLGFVKWAKTRVNEL